MSIHNLSQDFKEIELGGITNISYLKKILSQDLLVKDIDDLDKENTFDDINNNLIFLIKNKENMMFLVNSSDLSIKA